MRPACLLGRNAIQSVLQLVWRFGVGASTAVEHKRPAIGNMRFAVIALAALLLAGGAAAIGSGTGPAHAQTAPGGDQNAAGDAAADGGYDDRASLIEPGQLVVTGFSGTLSIGGGSGGGAGAASGRANADSTYIDPDGAALRVMDVSGPQSASDNGRGGAADVYGVTAREIGQVFGIALDDASEETSGALVPNIYATATSVYGLHLVSPDTNGDGWPDRTSVGGPDANWMEGLFGSSGGGGPGTVWKIDGITGEPSLFADLSDGDTPNGGAGLGNIAYDARTRQFFVSDLDSGLIHRIGADGQVIDVFDHGIDGRLADGQDAIEDDAGRGGFGSPDFRTDDPSSWGFTAAERRVWGLAVFDDRLFYAVADGPTIWSVELTEDGSFGAAQRELSLPRGSAGAEVADIAFTQSGTMILAQRPGVVGGTDFLRPIADQPGDVLRFERQADGSWQRRSESYAVGMRGSSRNASGGVALGYGRNDEGGLDYETCEAVLWATGDGLFEPTVPQVRSARLGGSGRGMVDGLQGVDIENVRPGNTPPVEASFIDFDGDLSARDARGLVGDVEIPYQCAESREQDDNGNPDVWQPQNPIQAFLPDRSEPEAPGFDLSLEKRALGACTVGGACWWDIIITNIGHQSFQGPLIISDRPEPSALPLMDTGSSGWNCSQAGGYIGCRRPAVHLAPGRSTTLRLGFRVNGGARGERLQNCSAVRWLGGDPEEELVRAVQLELTRLGYEPGGVDGLAGEGTARAVEDYQRDMELEENGQIDEDLVTTLFGPGAFATGDDDQGNDSACAETVLQDAAPVIAYSERPRPEVVEYVDDEFYQAPPVVYVAPPRPSLWLELNFWRPYCEPGFQLYRGRCEQICPVGFVSDGRRCRAVCYPGEVWRNGRCVAAWSRPQCIGGRYDGYRCECPRGMERAALGGRRFQCVPVRRGDVCEGGRFDGRACLCPRGASPRRVAPGRFVCVGRIVVPDRQAVRCDGGRVLGNSCLCPAGTRLTKTGRGRFSCERAIVVRPRDERIVCVGGQVADRRCTCPQGTRLVRRGGRQFACVAPIVTRPDRTPPTACIGGRVVAGNCLCPRGTTTVRAKGNRIRCVARDLPRNQNEPVSAGAVICESGRFDGRRCVCNRNEVLRKVGANKFRCDPSRGTALPGAGTARVPATAAADVTCVGGKLAGRRCECPGGQVAVRLGARAFRCQVRTPRALQPVQPNKPVPIQCAGGSVVNQRCVCVRGDRLTKVGPNNFRCVVRQPAVKQTQPRQPGVRDTQRNAQPTVVPTPRVNQNNQQQRLEQQRANQQRLQQQRLQQQKLRQQKLRQQQLRQQQLRQQQPPKAAQPAAKPRAQVACRGGRVVGNRCVCPNERQLSGGVCVKP